MPTITNQSWRFIGRTNSGAETPNTLATSSKEPTHWKRPWCWERLKAGGEGDDRGLDGWMASPTWWTRIWANSGKWWWMGKPGAKSRTRLSNWIELNWTELTIKKAAKWGLKSQKQIQHKFINSSLLQWVLSLCPKGLHGSHNSLVPEEWSLFRGISAAQQLLAVFCDCPAVWADTAVCVWWLRPATCGL